MDAYITHALISLQYECQLKKPRHLCIPQRRPRPESPLWGKSWFWNVLRQECKSQIRLVFVACLKGEEIVLLTYKQYGHSQINK